MCPLRRDTPANCVRVRKSRQLFGCMEPGSLFRRAATAEIPQVGTFPIAGSIERVPTFDFPLTSLCFLVHFAAFRNSEYIFIEEFRIKYFARFSLALCSVFIGSHRSIILAVSPLVSSDFLFFP